MFEQPSDDPAEPTFDPTNRAREKADEFRMHAELFAVFEGPRKFKAELLAGLDPDLARQAQRSMARLEKSRSAESPLIPEASTAEAADLLNLAAAQGPSTNDYHIHRRLGEVVIVRWLYGEQVESFYERLQAHFDAAMEGFKEDERQALEWKKDPETLAYLAALDALEVRMADRYLRDAIRQHNLFVLSTQMADEINIAYLSDYVMGVAATDIVGPVAAPPEAPTEHDLAWFFKLFSLRGMRDGVEKMCFLAY
jgi:hypothetical protein